MSERERDDGGPAFPLLIYNNPWDIREKGGMSLRDWFAGQALQGYCAFAGAEDPLDTVADLSYRMADAMLAARKKQ